MVEPNFVHWNLPLKGNFLEHPLYFSRSMKQKKYLCKNTDEGHALKLTPQIFQNRHKNSS